MIASPADAADISLRCVQRAFPNSRVLRMEPLSGGLRNSVTKLRLDSFTEPLVLRIFNHDPALCQKEIDLYQLIGDSVPVPEIIYAQPLWD